MSKGGLIQRDAKQLEALIEAMIDHAQEASSATPEEPSSPPISPEKIASHVRMEITHQQSALDELFHVCLHDLLKLRQTVPGMSDLMTEKSWDAAVRSALFLMPPGLAFATIASPPPPGLMLYGVRVDPGKPVITINPGALKVNPFRLWQAVAAACSIAITAALLALGEMGQQAKLLASMKLLYDLIKETCSVLSQTVDFYKLNNEQAELLAQVVVATKVLDRKVVSAFDIQVLKAGKDHALCIPHITADKIDKGTPAEPQDPDDLLIYSAIFEVAKSDPLPALLNVVDVPDKNKMKEARSRAQLTSAILKDRQGNRIPVLKHTGTYSTKDKWVRVTTSTKKAVFPLI